MKRYMWFVLTQVSLAVFVLTVFAPAGLAQFRLLSARRLDGPFEISTTAAPAAGGLGGLLIFNENVAKPGGHNVIVITLSGTGDSHSGRFPGAQMDLGCRVTVGRTISLCNEPFNPQVTPNTPSGWVSVQRYRINPYPGSFGGDGSGGAGDWHDNNINQTWCEHVATREATVNVQLRLASNPVFGSGVVFLDNVKTYIESARVLNPAQACTLKR